MSSSPVLLQLYDCLRGKAGVQPVNGLYYRYRCNNASKFCRILPEFSCSPNSLDDYTAEMNGDEYLPVMIDLEYDAHNSLVQDYKNIVKNDTIIYCVNGQSCYDEAVDPIRVVINSTELSCQPTISQPTASLSTVLQQTVPQPTASLSTVLPQTVPQPTASLSTVPQETVPQPTASLSTVSQKATPSVHQTMVPANPSTDAGQSDSSRTPTFISVHVLGLVFDAGNIILSLITLMILCCN